MDHIEIIKHKETVPLKEHGDILYPFEGWHMTSTGANWYTKIPDNFYTDRPYYPLTVVAHNPWAALDKLFIRSSDFQEKSKYVCPYTGYVHFWCVPLVIFTQDIKLWLARCKVPKEEMYLNRDWMKRYFSLETKNGLPFTKIQRSLLGSGYTDTTKVEDGNSYLYDALVALDNKDFLGVKVWMWFNKI